MRRLLIAFFFFVLLSAQAWADSLVHGLGTNTTSPLPAGSCLYVDQGPGTDTKLCSGWAAALGGLVAANNLSDLTSASTARTNLGLTPVFFVGAFAGSANAYTMASPTPSGFTLTDQFTVCGQINVVNTGATTWAINGLSATAVKRQLDNGLAALVGGELPANAEVCGTYQSAASAFVLTTVIPGAITSAATSQTISQTQWSSGHVFVPSASQTFTLPASGTTLLAPNGGIILLNVNATTLQASGSDTINGGSAGGSLSLPAGTLSFVTGNGASPTAFSVETSSVGSGSGTVTSVSPGAGVATSLTGGQTAITTAGTVYADASFYPFFLGGLTLSNDGTSPNTVIDVAAGVAVSDDSPVAGSVMMKLAAFTKTLGAWTLGTGNGCLDTGSVANATWYHVFLIERTDTGVVDILCSTNVSSPTFPTNYTKKRRIGSLFTCDTIVCAAASTNIAQYTQRGTVFLWKNLQASVAPDITTTTLGTSSALFTMAHVPPGVNVQPICRYTISNAGNSVILTGPDEPDLAPTTATPFGATGSPGWDQLDTTLTAGDQNSACPFLVTNTAQQVRARASAASTTLQVVVRGYVD